MNIIYFLINMIRIILGNTILYFIKTLSSNRHVLKLWKWVENLYGLYLNYIEQHFE